MLGSSGDGVGAISEGFSLWSSCDGTVRFHISPASRSLRIHTRYWREGGGCKEERGKGKSSEEEKSRELEDSIVSGFVGPFLINYYLAYML